MYAGESNINKWAEVVDTAYQKGILENKKRKRLRSVTKIKN